MRELFDLSGQVALVTGGGRGLGAAQCRALASAGALVVVADVLATDAQDVAEDIAGAGGRAEPAALDVTDATAVEQLLDDLCARFGGVDVLVNNAAITARDRAYEFPTTKFDSLLAVNVRAAYFVAQATAQRMRERGGGRIVNIASIGGQVVDGERSSVYDMTKAAVIQMTKNLAYEWAADGIRVNAIAPGYMRTQMTAELLPDQETTDSIVRRHIPLGRIGEPDDLAGPVLFLASSASAYVTGHTLNVDGGWVIC
ncbi:glucose 1-dehydrogenase [Saccharopolyspora sp. NPDC002686]|uniref:SDR family NAD(P)-dependent oxidoreductase n=1 Tax=Saccharopolyspora sp. NPDC002686 TaxID=3154541 RepID=UPI00332C3CF1